MTIREFADLIGQNWIGVTLGLVSLVIAIYEAKKNRGPLLCFQYTGRRLIRTDSRIMPEGLEVAFNGNPVNNLSMTEIIFWNAGRAPVRSSDIPNNDKIRFSFSAPSKILLASITKITRRVTNGSIDYQPGSASPLSLTFDFFDRDDGVLVTVWHDGSSTTPIAQGTIVGQKSGPISLGRYIPAIRNAYPRINKRVPRVVELMARMNATILARYFLPYIMIGYGLIAVFLTLPAQLGYYRKEAIALGFYTPNDAAMNSGWFVIVVGTATFFMGVLQLYSRKRRFPKSLVPDDEGNDSKVSGDDLKHSAL